MKNKLFLPLSGLLGVMLMTNTIQAQFTAVSPYNNYNTILRGIQNPSSISGSSSKIEFNLLGMQVGGLNDAYTVKFADMFKRDTYKNPKEGLNFFRSSSTADKSLAINADILGPSVMVNIGRNSAVGLTTRIRMVGNFTNITNDVQNIITNTLANTRYKIGNANMRMNAFAEAGLTYAYTFDKNPEHVFNIGITGKYILGIGALAARTNNAFIEYQAGRVTLTELSGDGRLLVSGDFKNLNLDNPSTQNVLDIIGKSINTSNSGIGGDVGVTWEWRPEGKATNWSNVKGWLSVNDHPYKVRVGASITDIGSVSYSTNTPSGSYTLTGSGKPESIFKPQLNETVNGYVNRLANMDNGVVLNQAINKFTMNLPMAAHVNVDYHVLKAFYINANALINLVSKTADNQTPYYFNTYSLTPHIDLRRFSAFMPVSYDELKNFNAGFGFQIGPLLVGSQTILTNLFKEKTGGFDFYAGLNYRIFKSRPDLRKPDTTIIHTIERDTLLITKDRDGDGVVDDQDDCPDTPGLVALNGCPDRDGDGISDPKDSCIDVPGVAKYHGCPVPDRDGDGINDDEDKCPDVPGVARYQGCPIPDRDGDGVNDEEDKCPDVPGTVANFGCPEIKQDVIQKFNKIANQIYFATGKSTILSKSFKPLNEVVKSLNENPTYMLEIEGHTDNVGKDEYNMTLSEKRAAAVKAYLVKKGIDPARLTSKGYGETQPIADNKTAKGRAKNRRSVLKLRNY